MAFDIKKTISKNGILSLQTKEELYFFYKKTKCNVIITSKNTYFSKSFHEMKVISRLNIVLTKCPSKYKEIFETYKNTVFTDNEKIHENIFLFPKHYNEMHSVLEYFFKLFIMGENEVYIKHTPTCKVLWVTKVKSDYGCDLFFDYNLENEFSEEKVFENNNCCVYKYTKL